MTYYVSKTIINAILCFTIISVIDKLQNVQSMKRPKSFDVQSMKLLLPYAFNDSICGKGYKLDDCLRTFSHPIKAIDKLHLQCHLTMLAYIDRGLAIRNKMSINVFNHYNYMILRSYTDAYGIYSGDSSITFFQDIQRSAFMAQEKAKDFIQKLDEVWIEKYLKGSFILNADDETINELFNYCNQTLSTLSDPTNGLEEHITEIYMNHVAHNKFPILMTFGPILYLMKNEEVENFKIQDDPSKFKYVMNIMGDAMLDIFCGLMIVLYNYKELVENRNGHNLYTDKLVKDSVYIVFHQALETAQKLFSYEIEETFLEESLHIHQPPNNELPYEDEMEDFGGPDQINLSHQNGNLSFEEPDNIDILYKTAYPQSIKYRIHIIEVFMEHVKSYKLSNEKYKNVTLNNGRLFKNDKVEPSLLQYYSVLSVDTDWKIPIQGPLIDTDKEVLLNELNAWTRVIDYYVTQPQFDENCLSYCKNVQENYKNQFNLYFQAIETIQI